VGRVVEWEAVHFRSSMKYRSGKAKTKPIEGGHLMKTDRMTKILLGVIAFLLFLNFLNRPLSSKQALAAGGEDKGRYQISAWGAQAQIAQVHSGYYVLDTATGQIVASKMEVHQR
jgi:hypothetical protein